MDWLLSLLPYALLLLCPLMMLFMHGGRGHGGHDHAHDAHAGRGPGDEARVAPRADASREETQP